MLKMKVRKIEHQPDRKLLFSDRDDYFVIASLSTKVEVGDIIKYEPYGVNFGFMEE